MKTNSVKTFLLILLSIFFLSSCQSREDKALSLINQYMKTVVYNYDSYEVNQIKIDSAYTKLFMMEDAQKCANAIIDAKKKLEKEQFELSSNKSSMAIYTPSSYSDAFIRNEYSKYKMRVEENQKNIVMYQEQIVVAGDSLKNYTNSFESRFAGWGCMVNYRCKNFLGMNLIRNGYFIVDRNFSELLFAAPDIEDNSWEEIMDVIEEYTVE